MTDTKQAQEASPATVTIGRAKLEEAMRLIVRCHERSRLRNHTATEAELSQALALLREVSPVEQKEPA